MILLFIFFIFFFLDTSLQHFISYDKGLVMMNSFNLT